MQLRIKQDQRGISNVIVVMLSLVILVIISANVILWSYQMNQLDWEKMQEDINIVDIRNMWSCNPSGYSLGGSTSLVSGSVSNLTSDDGVYMTFRSYYSGTDTSDFVDNNTSDVDSSPDIGSHSNFTAQRYGPDNIFDILTEARARNITLLDDGFEAVDWDANWDQYGSDWERTSGQKHSGAYSAEGDSWDTVLISDDLDASGATYVYVEFWFRKHNIENNEFTLHYWNGTQYNLIQDLDLLGLDDVWIKYEQKVSDSQYFRTDFHIKFDCEPMGWFKNVWVDDVLIKKEAGSDSYELDVEVQWTSVDFDETNEELCIYGGTMGTEDIRVDVWYNSAWQNLFTDLSSGWNNVSVSSYLDSSTFTIRFKGGIETGDSTQDSWNIDATLLHVWSDEYTTEVEFLGSSNTEDWTKLNWTIDSAWTAGSVSVTLQLYNYTLSDYPTSGNGYMAYTSDGTPNTDETKNQTITVNPTHFRNATGYWRTKVKGVKATDTQFDFKADWIEFKVGIEGTLFTFENRGSLTAHLVSLWVINSTHHQRYDIDVILNSGETLPYLHVDISLPSGQYLVKVVTERGNIAVFSGG